MKYWVVLLILLASVVANAGTKPSLRFSEIDLSTGVRLHYGEQGDASGHPVVMLHGYTDSWFSYSRILPLLDSKYHVFVLDQRGHGDSQRPWSDYTFAHFAADALAFMDARHLRKATIVGHSMGSFVAQHIAARAPDRVERLILVGSAPSVKTAAVNELRAEINKLTERVTRRFAHDFQVSTLFRPVPDEFLTRVVDESLKVPARVWKDVMAGMLISKQVAFNKITARTLIIWGDRETVFPDRKNQDELVSSIKDAELRIYSETGHSPHWERPEQFAKDLQDFLN